MIIICNTKYIINYKYFNSNHRKSKISDRLTLAKKHCPISFCPQLYVQFQGTDRVLLVSRGMSEGKKSFQILDGIVGVMFEVIYLAHNRYTRQKNITFLKDVVLKHAKKRMSRKQKSSTSATTSTTNLIAADDDLAIDQQIDDQDNIDSDGENI
jgi:hypothetical protein